MRTDDWLIAQYLRGDAGAFEELFDRYSPRLIGFLIGLGSDRDGAEDMAQKTWMRALAAFDRYEARGTFRAWLFTAAHRIWLDEQRSAWQTRRVTQNGSLGETDDIFDQTPAGPRTDPRETAIRHEEGELLNRALRRLPEAIRETVLLRVDGDLTLREIAEHMNCPLGTVQWRMHEGQRRLKELLSVFPGMAAASAEPLKPCYPETGGDQG